MRYWRRPPSDRPSSNPKYDVNINVIGSDQIYEIIQQSFILRDGGRWHVIENGNLIATMSNGSFTEKDRIEVQLGDHTTLLIDAKGTLKVEGSIAIDGEYIGKTTVNGWFFNSYYEVEVSNERKKIDPALLAGVAYTFWSTSNRR